MHTDYRLPADNLVIETLPNGETAYLRPAVCLEPHDDVRYTITDAGRRAIALVNLFGRPWPTVAEASPWHREIAS